jgi:hypothetical protein
MLRSALSAILLLLASEVRAAEPWRRAEEADTKAVVNCLIDQWLRDSNYSGQATRRELHIKVVKSKREAPHAKERGPLLSRKQPFFCIKGRQADYYSWLFRDGELVLTNGKPIDAKGEILGSAYGVMPVYRKDSLLAIYVEAGSWSSRKMRNGKDCVYDATNHAHRNFFRGKISSLSFLGTTEIWIADTAMPTCLEEFLPQNVSRPALLQAGKVPQPK